MNGMDQTCADALVETMANHPTLKSLCKDYQTPLPFHMSASDYWEEGVCLQAADVTMVLASVIRAEARELDLTGAFRAWCEDNVDIFEEEAGRALRDLLTTLHAPLETLDLTYNRRGSAFFELLAEGIAVNGRWQCRDVTPMLPQGWTHIHNRCYRTPDGQYTLEEPTRETATLHPVCPPGSDVPSCILCSASPAEHRQVGHLHTLVLRGNCLGTVVIPDGWTRGARIGGRRKQVGGSVRFRGASLLMWTDLEESPLQHQEGTVALQVHMAEHVDR